MDKSIDNIFNQTGFLRLSEEERTQLFTQFAESRLQIKMSPLKTRQEGESTSECQKQKKAAVSAAKLKFDNSVSLCGNVPAVAQLCYMNAASVYNFEVRMAEKAYQECIGN